MAAKVATKDFYRGVRKTYQDRLAAITLSQQTLGQKLWDVARDTPEDRALFDAINTALSSLENDMRACKDAIAKCDHYEALAPEQA